MTATHGTYSANNLDGRPKKHRFYLKDGSNFYRVLPPFGSLSKQGILAKYWAVYWMPTTKTARDGKPICRPVPSILQKNKEGKIFQPDPLFDRIELFKKTLEAAKAAKSQPEAILAAMEDRAKGMNLDKAYYLNVLSPSGEIGVLKLRYTAFQGLKEKLRELDKSGIDPINVGVGLFFDFKKLKDDKGKTVYTVEVQQRTYKNQQTGKITTEMVESPIDEVTLKRMETEAFDLATLYKPFSPEEQAAIASLDPKVIDRLFARPEENDAEEGQVYEDEGEDLKAGGTTVAGTGATGAAQTAPAPAQAEATAQQAAAPAAQATVTTPPATTQAAVAQAAVPAQTAPAAVGGPAPTQAVDPANFGDLVKNFLQTGQATANK